MTFEACVPTYKRPDSLLRMIASLRDTLNNCISNIKCFVYFSYDDESSFIKTQNKINDVKGSLDVELVLLKTATSLVEKLNLYFAEHATRDAVFGFADDITFMGTQIIDAMAYYEQHFQNLDVAMALKSQNIYDTKIKYNNYSFCLLGRAFIDRFPKRQVYCPAYVGHAIDDELCAFAKRLGKWNVFEHPDLIIHHRTKEDLKGGIAADGYPHKDSTRIYRERKSKGMLWGT